MTEPIYQDPRFDALRNAIYHSERSSFLDTANRLLNFLVIVCGAGVAAKALVEFKLKGSWLELSVVFFATIQLVFDLGGKAKTHKFLQRRYYELLAEWEPVEEPTEAQTKAWSAKLLVISGDEPMTMRAVDALAYNKALDATSRDTDIRKTQRQYLTWYQRRMRHLIAFQSVNFGPKVP